MLRSEVQLNHRSIRDEYAELGSARIPTSLLAREDPSPQSLRADLGSRHLDVDPVDMDHEPRVCTKIVKPIAPSGCTGDDESTLHPKPPDLDPVRATGCSTVRSDVDRGGPGELVEL